MVMVMEMETSHSIPTRVQRFANCCCFQLSWESLCLLWPMENMMDTVMAMVMVLVMEVPINDGIWV